MRRRALVNTVNPSCSGPAPGRGGAAGPRPSGARGVARGDPAPAGAVRRVPAKGPAGRGTRSGGSGVRTGGPEGRTGRSGIRSEGSEAAPGFQGTLPGFRSPLWGCRGRRGGGGAGEAGKGLSDGRRSSRRRFRVGAR